MEIFDFLNSINDNKKNLMNVDPGCERIYVPYIINKSLSYFPDTLFEANMMNFYNNISKKMQYDYYLLNIRKKKRFSKWHKEKTTDSDDISIIKQYYGYSDKKAVEASKILTKEQINHLKNELNTGGNIK
jgi:hypothetical protein